MPKRASSARDLILGLLFFGGLFGLAFVTTQLTNFPLTGHHYSMTVLFEDINGVQREDKVLVFGTRYGRVRRTEPISAAAWEQTGRDLVKEGLTSSPGFTPHVMAVLELEQPLELKSGYQIFAEDNNLLGGKVISIRPGVGTPLVLPEDDGDWDAAKAEDLRQLTLIGVAKPHPITAIGKLVENNLDDLDTFVDNLVAASERLSDPKAGLIGYALNDKEAVAKVDGILDRVSELTERANQGDNLLTDLLNPGPLRDNLRASVDNVKTFTDGLNNKDSLLGGLIATDSPMKTRVDSILTDGQSFVAKLNREDSLVGRALAEGPDSLGGKVDGAVDNLASAASQVSNWVSEATNNPESLLYQISKGDLGTHVRSAVEGIDRAVSRVNTLVLDPIERNDSLAGLVFNDPDIRKKVERIIGAALGVLEDAREAAPVTSLGSFIFGGF